jgi:hypothetical protein
MERGGREREGMEKVGRETNYKSHNLRLPISN